MPGIVRNYAIPVDNNKSTVAVLRQWNDNKTQRIRRTVHLIVPAQVAVCLSLDRQSTQGAQERILARPGSLAIAGQIL